LFGGVDNTGSNPEISELLKKQSEEVKRDFDLEKLAKDPKIIAWREAYSSFGAKPKKHRCSVETLYRLILEGIELRSINKLVDLYNYISLKYMLPVGGDDIDRVDGNIVLRFAQGTESFVQLNSDRVDRPKKGEVIYADDKEVLCRRWNWRECDKSKMTEKTKNVALVIEGLPPATTREIRSAMQELGRLISKFCGGSTKSHLLDNHAREIKIK
jgi:lysyl-tRNA synthetase class 2